MAEPTFTTRRLPAAPDAVAPDGSDVRILIEMGRGGLAHFTLAAGATSVAVRHRTVEEIWYFLSGRGQLWRRDDSGTESIVDVERGDSISIPLGTHFQFRAVSDDPLVALGCTMPPWPGDGEAIASEHGPWVPTVSAGPGLSRE
jgi:mannose-6-phosphate isomerase-like protein (cupin superfamily)